VSLCVGAEKAEAREARKIEAARRRSKACKPIMRGGKAATAQETDYGLPANNELKTQRLVERAGD
jgi:hypothetical protein